MHPWLTRTLTVLAIGALSGCAALSSHTADRAVQAGLAAGVPLLHPMVLATVPHDTDAWTEGLELADGVLYEGTGRLGHSQLRELDPTTGRVLRSAPVPDGRYGEGITVLGDRIWQLTYTEQVAIPWARATLRPGPPLPYSGEGWGLCHIGGGVLVASDGTDRLRLLRGTDLHQVGSVSVRIAGRPLPALNELECLPGVGRGVVLANLFPTNYLAKIDLNTGTVTAIVDASALVPPSVRNDPDAALNGIAALPGTDELLLTGKLWPTLYRVRLTPSPPHPASR